MSRFAVADIVAERRDLFKGGHGWPDKTLADYLDAAAEECAARVGVVDADRKLTYEQYRDRVKRLAAWFVDADLTEDDVIAVQLPNCIEFAITVNAAVMAGVPFCQCHIGFSKDELRFIIEHTKARAIVVPSIGGDRKYVRNVEEINDGSLTLKWRLAVGDRCGDGWEDLGLIAATHYVDESRLAGRRPHPDAVMRVAFTSGTTSDPKAVIHTHNSSLGSKYQNIVDELVDSESVVLVFLPVGLNWGLGETVRAVMAKCTLVYMRKFDAVDALRLIQQEGVTHFSAAPAALVSLMDACTNQEVDLSSLRAVVVGGAPCPPAVAERWRAMMPGILLERYGALETGTAARTVATDDPRELKSAAGRPPPDSEIRIVDEENRDLSPGAVGEIVFRGPGVAFGYYDNPAATAAVFLRGGWYRTGDLGSIDDLGYLHVTGRRKEMIIRAGANVYPREVEDALMSHPDVSECAVIGVPHDRVGEKIGAVIVPRRGASISLAELREFLQTKIASYKLPEYLFLEPSLPRTSTGKAHRRAVDLERPIEIWADEDAEEMKKRSRSDRGS